MLSEQKKSAVRTNRERVIRQSYARCCRAAPSAYANGERRAGDLDQADDHAQLVTFDEIVECFVSGDEHEAFSHGRALLTS